MHMLNPFTPSPTHVLHLIENTVVQQTAIVEPLQSGLGEGVDLHQQVRCLRPRHHLQHLPRWLEVNKRFLCKTTPPTITCVVIMMNSSNAPNLNRLYGPAQEAKQSEELGVLCPVYIVSHSCANYFSVQPKQ